MKSKITEIIILGASTAFYEIKGIIDQINSESLRYKVIGILDDNEEMHGRYLDDVNVIGSLNRVNDFPDAKLVLGIGSMKTRLIRQDILLRLGLTKDRFETIIHPSAVIDKSAQIDAGCIIHPGVVIGNNAKLSSFVIIAVNSAIGPYTEIDDFSMITSLVVILSSAKIGKAVFVGSLSCVTENITIGAGTMIGAGTVVSRNLDKGVFYLGNPGRILSKIEIPNSLN